MFHWLDLYTNIQLAGSLFTSILLDGSPYKNVPQAGSLYTNIELTRSLFTNILLDGSPYTNVLLAGFLYTSTGWISIH